MPKISIIIPAKNEEKVLPVLLQSIKSQTFQDYEIIVADAFSTDRTREVAQVFGARVVDGGMPGPGRNKGALAAQGDILLFLDADVLLPAPKFLDECLEEMERKDLDVATCRVRPLGYNLVDHAMHSAYNVYTYALQRVFPHAPGFCIMAKRQVHQALGGFDETVVFAEDHDYVHRAHKAGYKFRFLMAHPIKVSVRRLDKDGRLGIALKYIYGEYHLIARGPIRKDLFKYEMGGEEEKEKQVASSK